MKKRIQKDTKRVKIRLKEMVGIKRNKKMMIRLKRAKEMD